MTRNDLREYKKLNKEINEMKARLEEMKKNFIGEANETGIMSYDWTDMGYKVSECHRDTIDSKRLKAEHPEIYAEYLNTTVFQQFRAH